MSCYDKKNDVLNVRIECSNEEFDRISKCSGKLIVLSMVRQTKEGEAVASFLLDCSKVEGCEVSNSERDRLNSIVSSSDYMRDRALSIASDLLHSAANAGMSMKEISRPASEYEQLINEVHLSRR